MTADTAAGGERHVTTVDWTAINKGKRLAVALER